MCPPALLLASFFFCFDSMCCFPVLYQEDILDCLTAVAVTPQFGILGVRRKGCIRLRLFNRCVSEPTNWRMMHFKFTLQGHSIMFGKASNQSKTLLQSFPRYILHIDNHWVGSSSGPVGDKEVSLLWEQMWY